MLLVVLPDAAVAAAKPPRTCVCVRYMRRKISDRYCCFDIYEACGDFNVSAERKPTQLARNMDIYFEGCAQKRY